MFIGTMNHPEHDVLGDISWMADLGMEFVDLTLEPPGAASWNIDTKTVRAALQRHRMEVVGHTAWYLPMASAIPELRQGAVAELKRCLERFAEIGSKLMNIHPDRHTPWHDRRFYIEGNLASLEALLPDAERYGVG